MNGWHIKFMDNWNCWICGENKAVEWWAHEQAAKAYSICGRCKDGFLKVVVKRGIK